MRLCALLLEAALWQRWHSLSDDCRLDLEILLAQGVALAALAFAVFLMHALGVIFG